VLKERNPIYEQTMDFSIDTDNQNVIEITDATMQKIIAGRNKKYEA
jgi:shikimate kinase